MRIRKVHITGFGKLVDHNFYFNDTLNVVRGFNEAGKTTLVNAILGVLYGFKGRSEEMRLLKEKYRPWDITVPYKASMILNFGNSFDYYLERDFESDKTRLTKIEDGYELPCSLRIEDLLKDKLGLSNGKLFKSTLLVKQEEVAELHKTELSDAVIRKITEGGSGVSVIEVLQALGGRLKELNRGFGRQTPNPGPVKTCLEEIKMLKTEISEVSEYYQEFNQLRKRLNEKSKERKELVDRIEELGNLITAYDKKQSALEGLRQILVELKGLRELRDKIQEKETLLTKLERELGAYKEEALSFEALQRVEFLDRQLSVTEQKIDQVNYEYQKLKGKKLLIQREMGNHSKTIATYYSVRYNEKNLTEARRLNAMLANLKEEMSEKEKRLTELSHNQSPKLNNSFWIGLALCISSVAGIFAGNIWGYVAASILIVSGVMVIYFGRTHSKYGLSKELTKITVDDLERVKSNFATYQKILEGILDGEALEEFENRVGEQVQLKQKIQVLEEELRSIDLEPMEKEIDDLQRDLKNFLHQIGEVLAPANVGSVEEYREQLENLKNLRAEIKLVKDALVFLKTEAGENNIDSRIEDLEKEADTLRKIAESSAISEEQYSILKREIAEKEALVEKVREEEIKISASIENYNKLILQDRDLWSLKSALKEKEELLDRLELEGKGIETAVRYIQEATQEAKRKMAPQVKDKVAKIFQWITMKKYKDVRLELEGDNLIFQYRDNEYNLYRDLHFLSTGTRDQLYLALRIALGEYLTKCTSFPLLLDDPFVNFDNERLFKTIEILRILAKEHQIIWLTKDEYLLEQLQEAAVTQI